MKSSLLHQNGQKTFLLVFDKGDEILAGLKTFAREQHLAGSRFTAIGALSDVTLGFFDRQKKAYKKIPLREQVEVLSLAGNIGEGQEGPAIHAHIVVGGDDGVAHGGHLLEGHVWPTLEVVIDEAPAHLQRKLDPETGLALIDRAVTFQLSSSAFEAGGDIPTQYSCDGLDTSPPLAWQNPPEGTKSLALVMEDPDTVRGTLTHWLLYNIPPTMQQLAENVPEEAKLPGGALEGMNDMKKLGYSGPCPPNGSHRYFFRLYALDKRLTLPEGATRAKVNKAIEGHILSQAELMGIYRRKV